MTVKLLAQWGDQPPGTLYTAATAGTETAMIAAGQATANLAGGVVWVPPGGSPDRTTEIYFDPVTQSLVSGDGALVPLSYVLGMQHTAQSKGDGDAIESAALYTLDIPANTLGPNSVLRVRSLWTTPSSGATKRLRGRFGGTVLWNLDLTTHVSYPLEFILANRNSLASQIAQANNLSWAVALASSAVQTFTVDFATAQQLTITAQWPVAGAGSNNITLESVMVEHLYGR